MPENKIRKKTKAAGFNLLELAVVIISIGILTAIIYPQFAKIDREAKIASAKASAGVVRRNLMLALSSTPRNPTIQELADSIYGVEASANNKGVVITLASTTYLIPTYRDEDCQTPTNNVNNVVYCVGEVDTSKF